MSAKESSAIEMEEKASPQQNSQSFGQLQPKKSESRKVRFEDKEFEGGEIEKEFDVGGEEKRLWLDLDIKYVTNYKGAQYLIYSQVIVDLAALLLWANLLTMFRTGDNYSYLQACDFYYWVVFGLQVIKLLLQLNYLYVWRKWEAIVSRCKEQQQEARMSIREINIGFKESIERMSGVCISIVYILNQHGNFPGQASYTGFCIVARAFGQIFFLCAISLQFGNNNQTQIACITFSVAYLLVSSRRVIEALSQDQKSPGSTYFSSFFKMFEFFIVWICLMTSTGYIYTQRYIPRPPIRSGPCRDMGLYIEQDYYCYIYQYTSNNQTFELSQVLIEQATTGYCIEVEETFIYSVIMLIITVLSVLTYQRLQPFDMITPIVVNIYFMSITTELTNTTFLPVCLQYSGKLGAAKFIAIASFIVQIVVFIGQAYKIFNEVRSVRLTGVRANQEKIAMVDQMQIQAMTEKELMGQIVETQSEIGQERKRLNVEDGQPETEEILPPLLFKMSQESKQRDYSDSINELGHQEENRYTNL